MMELNDEQQADVLAAAAEFLIAAVENRSPADVGLSENLMAQLVPGSFVSIKRGNQLRSCCGTVGRPRPLAESLSHSARRTAKEDPRFPPISSSELPYLDIEVWLLGDTESVTEIGTDRVNSVEVGKHGLVVSQGSKRGLLLPGVPVEQGWDAEQFLNRVCMKAGLPPTAWKEADTVLQRFAGQSFSRCLLTESDNVETVTSRVFTPREFAQYAQHARKNIETMVAGGVPMYYVPQVPDKNVLGVGIVLKRNDDETEGQLVVSRVHWKNTIPMQSTLQSLCQDVVGLIQRLGLSTGEFQTWLFVADDSAMHGTADVADFAGLDVARRAILVVRGNQIAMRFDPNSSADVLLSEAVEQAAIPQADQTQVLSLEMQTNCERVAVAVGPTPKRGTKFRPPAVAGRFYPGNPAEINQQLDELFGGDQVPKSTYAAAMVPHAGWQFSGRIAADVFNRIELPKTIIVLGPKHTNAGMEWSVAPHEIWSLPSGDVASDPQLAQQLADAIPDLRLDAAAHQAEHGCEVELPLIYRLSPRTKVVGITIGGGNPERGDQFAEGLAHVIRDMPEPPLLLISSDMNHYANDAETRQLDELALRQIDALDADGLLYACRDNQISMCGVLAAAIVMKTLQRLGRLNKSERVAYATSCDVNGDATRTVGYAGILFS
ncbi:MAG: AmmeMemoRadiSam system protein B [Planctomycetaceae bacterium]